MKRQKREKRDSNIADCLPKDVYHELVTVFNPKCAITLGKENDEEYIPLEDVFREYTIRIKLSDIFEITLYFAVDMSTDDGSENIVYFLHGECDADEFSYQTASGYTYTEIKEMLHTPFEEITFLPPFLEFTEDEIIFKDQNSNTTFKLDKIGAQSLQNFKKKYCNLFRWILNKQTRYL